VGEGGGDGQRCEALSRLFAGEVPPRDIPGLPRCGVVGESAWVDELTRRAEDMEVQTATARHAAESGGAGVGGVGLLLAGDKFVSVDGVAVSGLTDQVAPHPGGNPGANLQSISHRCYLFEVAFARELTKETIGLPLGCLQGGEGYFTG